VIDIFERLPKTEALESNVYFTAAVSVTNAKVKGKRSSFKSTTSAQASLRKTG